MNSGFYYEEYKVVQYSPELRQFVSQNEVNSHSWEAG